MERGGERTWAEQEEVAVEGVMKVVAEEAVEVEVAVLEGEQRGAVGQAVWLRGLEELTVGVTVAGEGEKVVAVVVAAQRRRTRRERIAHVRYRRGGGL